MDSGDEVHEPDRTRCPTRPHLEQSIGHIGDGGGEEHTVGFQAFDALHMFTDHPAVGTVLPRHEVEHERSASRTEVVKVAYVFSGKSSGTS